MGEIRKNYLRVPKKETNLLQLLPRSASTSMTGMGIPIIAAEQHTKQREEKVNAMKIKKKGCSQVNAKEKRRRWKRRDKDKTKMSTYRDENISIQTKGRDRRIMFLPPLSCVGAQHTAHPDTPSQPD